LLVCPDPAPRPPRGSAILPEQLRARNRRRIEHACTPGSCGPDRPPGQTDGRPHLRAPVTSR